MVGKRKPQSPELKERIAILAVKGEQSINETASQCEFHPDQGIQGKKQLLGQAPELFSPVSKRRGQEKAEDRLGRYFRFYIRLWVSSGIGLCEAGGNLSREEGCRLIKIEKSDSLKLKRSQQREASQNISGAFFSVGGDFQESPKRDEDVNINRSKNYPNEGGYFRNFVTVS